ncbi:MAG: T9SS type A sorting domain-containing protein [Ferruginibacter sp.]
MKTIFTTSLFILFSIVSNGQTNVGGGIYANTVWTLSNSPYIVTNQLVLFPGYTLTIEPGVTIKFADGIGFECRGILIARGTASDSITFTSNSTNAGIGSWSGIVASALNTPTPTDQVRMEYCKGMYATNFIDLDLAYAGPYTFDHCYFYKNEKVNYDGGVSGVYFNYCIFESNNSALNYLQFGGRVTHSTFFNNVNGVDGFEHVDSCIFHNNSGVALSPYGSANGNDVYDNNIGVRCYFNSVNDTFINNQVHNNVVGVDILTYFNGFINFENNFLCNNSQYNIKNSGTNDVDLSRNCWCTNDSLQIRSKIYDGYVDPAFGLVTFTPIISNCNIPIGPTGPTDPTPPVTTAPDSVIFDRQITVYPNPVVNGVINIVLNKTIIQGSVNIFDIRGYQVYSSSFVGSRKTIYQKLPAGVYIVKVNDGKDFWVEKFVSF